MDSFISKKRKNNVDDENDQERQSQTDKKLMVERYDSSDVAVSRTDEGSMHGKYVVGAEKIIWRKINGENLAADYCILYQRRQASGILEKLENEIEWNTGKDSKVHIFGKWHDIPRKQAAYGDDGLSYTFSGHTVPAKPWTPLLRDIKNAVEVATGHTFNFVLVNRYKDGSDHIGEHRDDEKDLVPVSPIASVSVGQPRDFVFKHRDSRGKNATRKIDPVKIELAHGSLLVMKFPTNVYWYHALPVRKKALGTRINMTFRDFVSQAAKDQDCID